MSTRLCPVSLKVQHTTAARAKKAVAEQARKARDTGCVSAPQSIYRCLHCDRWHVTHYAPAETVVFRERDRLVRKFRKFAKKVIR